jgi:hypothetical protein
MITELNFSTMVGKKVRKKDIVVLLDGRLGQVLDLVTERVFKIKILETDHVDYFEDSKVKLKKQFFLNQLKDLAGL